jgi:hypothetical protein
MRVAAILRWTRDTSRGDVSRDAPRRPRPPLAISRGVRGHGARDDRRERGAHADARAAL